MEDIAAHLKHNSKKPGKNELFRFKRPGNMGSTWPLFSSHAGLLFCSAFGPPGVLLEITQGPLNWSGNDHLLNLSSPIYASNMQ